MAIRFTIDHYDPRNARPDLEHEYSNLMYACEICNVRKGDRYPPTEARKDGFRFYRADSDIYKEHFQLIGILLRGTSNVGMFSIQMLDLNRQALRRLRELRKRIADSDAFVAEGLAGLRRFPIDRLPKHMRPQALSATKRAAGVAQRVWDELDAILKENSRSPLIGEDAESEERKKARGVRLKEWMAMYEGNWHAPRKGK